MRPAELERLGRPARPPLHPREAERRDRRGARRLAAHRRPPRLGDPPQARGAQPRGRARRARARAPRPALTARSSTRPRAVPGAARSRPPRRASRPPACAGSRTRGGPPFVGDEEPLRDVGVAKPFGDEREHFELTRRQLRLVRPRRRARALREVADPQPSQLAGDHGRQRARAESLQLGVRLPQCLHAAGLRERERRLVRAAPSRPLLCCLRPAAGRARARTAPSRPAARRPRARRAAARRGAGTRPHRRPPRPTRRASPPLRSRRRPGERSSQAISAPAAARSTWAKRSSVGTPTAAARASASSRARVAAAGAHESEHAERLVVRPRRLARVADDRERVASGVVPATAIERPACCDRADVDPPQVLRVLRAVLDRGVEVPLDEVVALRRHRLADQRVHAACGDLVLAVPPGGFDCLLEQADDPRRGRGAPSRRRW